MEVVAGRLAAKALAEELPLEEALHLLEAPLDPLLEAAAQVKEAVRGRRLRLVRLLNVKSGACPEDCTYCAQSARYPTQAPRYPLLSPEAVLEEARRAQALGAVRFCLVGAYRRPDRRALALLAQVGPAIKGMGLELCASLGLLGLEEAQALKAAGVDYYNHNLNTSPALYPRIATTHTYADRLKTLAAARAAGLRLCSGVILGMGESPKEALEPALALRALGAESIPLNFLLPIPGTPLGEGRTLEGFTPERAIRFLALYRLLLPRAELRASAGRELYLAPYAPWVFRIADSVFVQGYLTQPGTPLAQDLALAAELGLEVEGLPPLLPLP